MGMKIKGLAFVGIALTLGSALAFLIGSALLSEEILAQSDPTIIVWNGSVTEGDTISLDVFLSDAPTGLAGFDIQVGIFETGASSHAQVMGGTVNSSFSFDTSTLLDSTRINLIGVDLGAVYEKGATNILLGTIELKGVLKGSIDIGSIVTRLDDDSGDPIVALISPGVLDIVSFMPTLSGESKAVRDNDGDGIAEDLNGNERSDFEDIILLFEHFDSLEVKGNVSLFDWDSNLVVNFTDVVISFNVLVQ